ncbi:MAG TPA: FkbM family methyltransferase [Allosphingosinicella sp.]|jgi:FkbM family methyltransferase
MFQRLIAHLRHVAFQAGRRLPLGGRRYRVKGYLPNRFSTSMTHEPHLQIVFRRLLGGRQGAFVDVGANLGQTLVSVLSIDPQRQYVGFEPQIMCCAFLTQFVADNGLSNVKIMPLALSNRYSVLDLHASNLGDVMATTLSDAETPVVASVPVAPGDEILARLQLERIAIIKIDVEGAEPEVMEGLRETIARCRPAIVFELLPNFTGMERAWRAEEARLANRERAARIHAFLTEAGYRVFQIDRLGGEHPLDRFELDDPANFVGSDYLALPDEAAAPPN